MSAIAFGDWHGSTNYAVQAIRHAKTQHPDVEKFIHVGDFGFWDTNIFSDQYASKVEESFLSGVEPDITPGDIIGYVAAVNQALEETNTTLYVCLGNHENYWELDATFGYTGAFTETGCGEDITSVDIIKSIGIGAHGVNTLAYKTYHNQESLYCTGMGIINPGLYDEDGFIVSEFFPRVKIIPRAHVWEWDTKHYASLGGAHSIDVVSRYVGASWWEHETITDDQVERFVNLLDGVRRVDYMITHDAPLRISRDLYGHGVSIPQSIRSWAEKSGEQVEKAMSVANPHTLVCGHHHVRTTKRLEDTTVEILDRDESPYENNMLLLS